MENSNLQPSSRRLPKHTSYSINRKFHHQFEANLYYYARRTDLIGQRLKELEREWDIERTLDSNAGFIIGGSLIMSLFRKNWLILGGLFAGFLAQNALTGWCPPVSFFRRMGIRTAEEINQEKFALKALRGDFKEVNPDLAEDVILKADKVMKSVEFPGGMVNGNTSNEK